MKKRIALLGIVAVLFAFGSSTASASMFDGADSAGTDGWSCNGCFL